MKCRKISSDEKRLIQRIIECGSDKNDIVLQSDADVYEIESEGTIKFSSDQLLLPGKWLPVEAYYTDSDGINVHAVLFIVEDTVVELEIYKDDGSAVLMQPRPEEWTIFSLA